MKRLRWIIPLLLCPLPITHAASAPDTDPAPPGLTLTLSTPQSSYVQGEPIQVTARYLNTGQQPFAIDDYPLIREQISNGFTVRVVDTQGGLPPIRGNAPEE